MEGVQGYSGRRLVQVLFVIFGMMLFTVGIQAQSYTDTDRLLTAVLTGYNRRIRPLADQRRALPVSVTLQPAAITEFDFVKEVLQITAIVKMSWTDETITWNPASYGNLTELLIPQSDVWVPTAILTTAAADIELLGRAWMYVRYNSSGYATYEPGALLESVCSLDVAHWPFDRQTCTLMFTALGYYFSEVILIADKVDMTFYSKNGEWDIESTSSASGIYGNIFITGFTFNLKRRPTFLIVNLLLPVIFLMALSVCVFLLPPESGERVGYSITVLLSISFFFTVITDFLPSISQPMAVVAYYIMGNFVISTLICLGTMFSLRIHTKPQTAPAPQWCNKVARLVRRRNKTRVGVTDTNDQEQIDTIQVKQPVEMLFPKSESELEQQETQSPEITWKQLGDFVDKILFWTFSLATTAFTMWFMIDMTTGNR